MAVAALREGRERYMLLPRIEGMENEHLPFCGNCPRDPGVDTVYGLKAHSHPRKHKSSSRKKNLSQKDPSL